MISKKKMVTIGTVAAVTVGVHFATVGGYIKENNQKEKLIQRLESDLSDVKSDSQEKESLIQDLVQKKQKSEVASKNTIEKLDKSLKSEKKKNEDLSFKLNETIAMENTPVEEVAEVAAEPVETKEVEAVKEVIEEPQAESSAAGRTLTVQATAYDGVSLGGLTATGLMINSTGDKVIAVDPNVIPLGSTVHVPGYGTAIAADTGGAIQGNIIDLNMSTAEAIQWGRQTVTITVVG